MLRFSKINNIQIILSNLWGFGYTIKAEASRFAEVVIENFRFNLELSDNAQQFSKVFSTVTQSLNTQEREEVNLE